jgi:hypothetical protein
MPRKWCVSNSSCGHSALAEPLDPGSQRRCRRPRRPRVRAAPVAPLVPARRRARPLAPVAARGPAARRSLRLAGWPNPAGGPRRARCATRPSVHASLAPLAQAPSRSKQRGRVPRWNRRTRPSQTFRLSCGYTCSFRVARPSCRAALASASSCTKVSRSRASSIATMRKNASLSQTAVHTSTGVRHSCCAAGSGGATPPCPHGRGDSFPSPLGARTKWSRSSRSPGANNRSGDPVPLAHPWWRTPTTLANLKRMASLPPMRSVTTASSSGAGARALRTTPTPTPTPATNPSPSPSPSPRPSPNQVHEH